MIRELKRARKVGSEVSASVAGKAWLFRLGFLSPRAEPRRFGIALGPWRGHSGLVVAGGADGAGHGALWA